MKVGMMKRNLIAGCLCLMMWNGISSNIQAQDRLYRNTFPLGDVELLDGPFKHAQELNLKVLMEYDVDRLLAPFLKEAGLPVKAEPFPNWAGLDGHVGGHYLSAMAMNYAATGNEECKKRMEYMLSELKRCQESNGDGYIGGIPNGKVLWTDIKNGKVESIWKYWAPWYNVHKIFAGLRDAWMYTGNQEALDMFLKLCDWGISVTEGLSDNQMEQMLANEFGGMDEIFADAYQITGEQKYLTTAKRFSHRWLFDSMAAHKDNLDNIHANTQIPKVIGYQRIAEVCGDNQYLDAADFFWNIVACKRSLALGGNSRREYFSAMDDFRSHVEVREGPESCNTYNMLKLTEGLFRMTGKATYTDFYERALYNHILSTQHPEHGGYVYFTSARPAHYRVYSKPNSAMWCCVGTGMENHGKYGEFIYTHASDSLFVNLFIPSRLNWEQEKVTITQETQFPDAETSRFTVGLKGGKSRHFKLLVRRPAWVTEGYEVKCNGKVVEASEKTDGSSYICIDRKWKDGDKVEVFLPMKMRLETLQGEDDFVAIMRGPILMGASVGTDNLDGLVADDGRWGHIASGKLVPLSETPVLIGSKEEVTNCLNGLKPMEGQTLRYKLSGIFNDSKFDGLVLESFSRIHDCRYMMYWLCMTADGYAAYTKRTQEEEKRLMALDARTLDAVSVGEQQPEVDHKMVKENSETGLLKGKKWRDARNGGYFKYTLSTNGKQPSSLMATYWGNEQGNRNFEIVVDGTVVATENIVGKWNKEEFVDVEYKLPEALVKGKNQIEVMFRSKDNNVAGGIFMLRLLTE